MKPKLPLSIPALRAIDPVQMVNHASHLAKGWLETAQDLRAKAQQKFSTKDLSPARLYRGTKPVDSLEDQLLVPSLATMPEIETSDRIAQTVYDHITRKDWDSLCDYLDELDETRSAVPSGRRHLEMAVFFVRRALSKTQHGPDDSSLETYYAINQTSLRQLSAVQARTPEDYILSALIARLHLDCGWAARRSTSPKTADTRAQTALEEHFETARQLVADFDPIAEDSPLLAEIQYRQFCGTGADDGLISEAFHDWLELDPTNMSPYRAHAFHLTQFRDAPRTRLEVAAQRAIAIGGKSFANSAYCLMYLEALRLKPDGFFTLNVDLFLESIEDLILHYHANAIRVTYLIQDCYQVFGMPGSGVRDGLDPVEAKKVDTIRAALPEVFSAYVSAFCPFAWDGTKEQFLMQIAPAFEKELARGARIQFSKAGAEILSR